jgi:cyanate lyase
MPAISMFYGLIIRMLFMGTKQHNPPHIHVEYQGQNAVFAIPSGELLEGNLPAKKVRQVQVWIDLHEEELMADWSLAVKGEPVFPIDPLR